MVQWRFDAHQLTRGMHSKGVPVEELARQIEHWNKERPGEPIRILIKGKKDGNIEAGKFVDPELYELYIEGYNSDEKKYGCMEDIPPQIWP